MNCNENKCLCESMCEINCGCIINHRLFEGYIQSVTLAIRMVKPEEREKKIIDLLQQFEPPKVSGAQIDRFYDMKRKGVNLDSRKKRVSKRLLKHHSKFKQGQTRKKRKVLLKSDECRDKKKVKKQKRSLVGDYLQRHNIDTRSLPKDQKQKVYTEAAEAVKIILSEPEPNFHYA